MVISTSLEFIDIVLRIGFLCHQTFGSSFGTSETSPDARNSASTLTGRSGMPAELGTQLPLTTGTYTLPWDYLIDQTPLLIPEILSIG